MAISTFTCIEAHTSGNPVRVITSGMPDLEGDTMSERRQHFLSEYDWIRTALMFEPQGHDLMSGSMLYPSTRSDCDIAVLFIETSGCLPMCGHGTIGTVTVAIEQGLVKPKTPGVLILDTPAGKVETRYTMNGERVTSVLLVNVPSYLAGESLEVECPDLGKLKVDVAYGGNFYAIVDRQNGYSNFRDYDVKKLLAWSPEIRNKLNKKHEFIHPEDPTICGISHVEWCGPAQNPEADAGNAVFYGDWAIDRSPCGTGTSARMAQLAARKELSIGDTFVHESIIGSLFRGTVLDQTRVGNYDAIIPGIEGNARIIGFSTRIVDDDDPYAYGFQVK